MQKFVAIGHITNDLEPMDHLGGSVAYTTVAASRLGYDSAVITKAPKNHPYKKYLEGLGIKVYLLPSLLDNITSFKNFYDEKGKRTQIITQKQEQITVKDLQSLDKGILREALILVAPVIGEVNLDTFNFLSRQGFLALTPQGYFRGVGRQGKIFQNRWVNFEENLRNAKVVIFSEEDITISGQKDLSVLDQIKKIVPITVLTEGERGATVFKGREAIHVDAYPLLPKQLVDFTGAGDSFATAFLLEYFKEKDVKKAATYACYFAAIKIMGLGGIGINSIPDRKQMEKIIKAK